MKILLHKNARLKLAQLPRVAKKFARLKFLREKCNKATLNPRCLALLPVARQKTTSATAKQPKIKSANRR